MQTRILVADDEPLTADMIALLLAFHGYEVVVAHDGEQALARARESKPHVVLLDNVMPGMEGPEVSRRLRADPGFADRGVIVLFSSVDEIDVDWRAAGADAFLQKPFELRALPELVEGLIAARCGPEEAGCPGSSDEPPEPVSAS